MADEASKSKKRKKRLEVSKARRKSKRQESLSESSSSDPSESSSSYSQQYRKKTKSKKDDGRNRNVSTDCSDRKRSLGKDKRQEKHRKQRREDLEKKKRRRKRSPSPMKQNKRRRYRSVSTCSDSSRNTSSSYLSDTCSTCSSTYNKSGEGRVKKRRSDSSKKSYRRWGLTKKNGHKEPKNMKTTNSYKNVRDELDTESPKRKAYRHRDSSCSVEHCVDNDMSTKRKRDHAVGRDNFLVDGQEDSCDDGKHSSEPLSSVVKFGNGEQVCGSAASDAVDLELLLRKKALENLIKFRRFGSGTTKIPLSYESERPLFVDSKEDDGTGSGLCGTMEFRRDEQNLTENIPDEHLGDVRRDAYRQPSKDALNILVHDTFGTDGPCSNRHKCIEIRDNESLEPINMNEEHTCKSEMAELEEPVNQTSQDYGLRTDIVSNRSTCKALEACTSKNEKSQTHMFPVDKDNPLPMEMSPLDVITMPSKNKTSKTEMTKEDRATTERLDIDASRIGMPNLDDSNRPKLKDSSFQKKTMAVRHGGETVQVSYKVYIPERSAAMARRQLKR